MSKIPQEIITDILLQLQVKSLIRFRSLSKPICSLIDGPDFINHHLTRSIETKSNHSIILKEWSLYTVDFDALSSAVELKHHPLYAGGGTEVVGCVNGLAFLRNSERNIALYNFSTREGKRCYVAEIVPPRRDLRTGYVYYGFGYDSVSDDYKIVRMAQFVSENENDDEDFDCEHEVKVYSLRNDNWKKIIDLPSSLRLLRKPFFHLLYRRGYGVFVSRALHWILPQRPELGLRDCIIGFDIGVDKFIDVPQPEYENKGFNFQVDVGVLEGNLCVMCNHMHVCVDVWVMKDYGLKESWCKMFSVKGIKSIKAFGFLRPLLYSKDGGEVLLEVNDEKLLWYDWKNRRATTVKIQGAPSKLGSEMYVGSLVRLNGGDRIEWKKQEREEEEKRITDMENRDDFLSVGFKLKL